MTDPDRTALTSELHGTVVRVDAAVGDVVGPDTVLALIESWKTHRSLKA